MRNLKKYFFKEQFFDNNEECNIKSPEDKIHFDSEPDSAKHGDKDRVNDELRTGIPVVSQNVINVMAEKSRYGHVETVKKIRNGRALEREIKVLRKIHSEASSKSPCHIAVSGKIKEDHHRENKHIKPCTDD